MAFRRTNAVLRLTACRNADKSRLLALRLSERPAGVELFRARTPRAAKGLLDFLRGLGRECRIYDGGGSPPDRLRTESWFASAESPALIAVEPVPFPRIRDDVRSVFVMNLPPSLADAAADLDTAGRDGLDCAVEFFASGLDRKNRLESMACRIPPEERDAWRRRLDDCVEWLENDGCARVFLARRLSGKEIGVCGNCGWCLGRKSARLPEEDG